jgi:hypothetical protein
MGQLAGFVHEKTVSLALPNPGLRRAAAFAAAAGETEDSTRVATAGFEESMSKSQVKPGSHRMTPGKASGLDGMRTEK